MRIFWAIAIAVLPLVTFGQVPFSVQDRAFITSTSPLRNGLAGYWRLEEASGTRYDCSKNGLHLTSNNSVGQGSGVSAYTGNCSTFVSASSQYLSIADNSSLSIGVNNSFTVCAWVFLTSTASDRPILGKVGPASNVEYLIRYQSSSSRFRFALNNGTTTTGLNADSLGAPSVSTWYFVCAWWDSGTSYIQVNNGTVDSTSHASGAYDFTYAFEIGGWSPSSVFMSGRVDEAAVWKRILTSSERTQLYNAGLGTHFPWAHP